MVGLSSVQCSVHQCGQCIKGYHKYIRDVQCFGGIIAGLPGQGKKSGKNQGISFLVRQVYDFAKSQGKVSEF